MKEKTQGIRITVETYKEIKRLKKKIRLPIKYIVEEAISLLCDDQIMWTKQRKPCAK